MGGETGWPAKRVDWRNERGGSEIPLPCFETLNTRMSRIVRALLSGVVDYAGMFPPARLTFEQSLENYARLQATPHAWMLGRFVCSAPLLGQLLARVDADPSPPPVAIAFPPSEAPDPNGDHLRKSLGVVDAIVRRSAAGVEDRPARRDLSAEFKLPEPLLRQDQEPAIEALISRVRDCEASFREVFLEIPLSPSFEGEALARIAALARDSACGLKFRTGGLQASAVPSPPQLARAIAVCRDVGVRWKATAGLHHPLRHWDEQIGGLAHGFLNVLAATVLAHALGLDEDRLTEILEDESAGSFVLADDRLQWRDLAADTAQVEAARREAMASFGSCSFDEPVEGLRALGLL